MVAVLTKGTLTDPEMLQSHSDASYVVSLREEANEGKSRPPFAGCLCC